MRRIGWRVSIKSIHCDRPIIIECEKFTLEPNLILKLCNVHCVKVGMTDVTGVLRVDKDNNISLMCMTETHWHYQSIHMRI